MRLKKFKLTVCHPDKLRALSIAALTGGKPFVRPDELFFHNFDSLCEFLTSNKLEILHVIIEHKPESIYQLAKILKRDFKNVWLDVTCLETIGLVELKSTKGSRRQKKPIAKYSGIEIKLAA